jgi:hypothetical protein
VAGSSSRIHDIIGHTATGLDRRSADAVLRRMADPPRRRRTMTEQRDRQIVEHHYVVV